MKGKPAPRIYCIPAVEAPVVAVLARGPSNWSWVGRWDLERRRFDSGGWLRGRVFPRRSDLSPDGRYLCYFAHKPGAGWEHGETYVAVSKLPWLTALHTLGTCGTWTRGYFFAEADPRSNVEDVRLPNGYGLRPNQVVQFAVERRRGWTETADSPRRAPGDFWDERRNARLQKRQPGGKRLLCVESLGWVGGEFGVDQAVDGVRVGYSLETEGDIEPLSRFQWADWDRKGRLLVATRDGRLQIRDLDGHGSPVLFEEDLCSAEPSPIPSPPWANRW